MIDNNIATQKPLRISCGTPVENERSQRNNTQHRQNFEPVRSKNPGHDGCKVTQEQVEAARAAEPAQSQQAEGTQKASGSCPGGNLIAQILQDLLGSLESVKTNP
ncbi:MAG: hypothetical protein R3F02_05250 [Thiolinea sp.]